MSNIIYNMDENLRRQRLAVEVLELGEALFELALEQGGQQGEIEGDNDEPGEGAISDELRAAKSEFFVALRLLLGSAEA